MGDKEVNITYETLFELLRREKNREELQQLDESFFKDVVDYLKAKKELLEQQKTKQDLFAVEERKKAEQQEENIRKILREFYERREKKIINMAMDRSRTSSSVVDTSVLLKEERAMYDYLVDLLDRFRRGVLFNLLEAAPPKIEAAKEVEAAPGEKKEEVEEKEKTKTIKFVNAVPRFVGEDLEEYGPYDGNDVADLPLKIAEVLIDKGRAEEME